VVFTRPQPQAPNLLGATGTGQHAGHGPLVPMEGANQASARHGPLGPMEESNEAGAGHGPLGPMEGSNRLFPGFWPVVGRLTRSGSREFKGRPRDNKTIGTVQLKLPFPRSIDKGSTGACGAHQATAPSTQLVGCDGDWPAYRSEPGLGRLEKTQLTTTSLCPVTRQSFFSERNFPPTVEQPVVTEYRCF
jgi:hypothetical protein